jgi:hypothetical protein
MTITPPIVAVPFLAWCVLGTSTLICEVAPIRLKYLITKGAKMKLIKNAVTNAPATLNVIYRKRLKRMNLDFRGDKR